MASASPIVDRTAGMCSSRSGDAFEFFEDDGTKTPADWQAPWTCWGSRRSVSRDVDDPCPGRRGHLA